MSHHYSDQQLYFYPIDYVVFSLILIISALIGVYFGFISKIRQNNTKEYLIGGKKMGIFPVSMSLIASYISGISILGLPSEIYMYGTQYWVIILSETLVSATMIYVYLPVFYKTQIISSYEYLGLRFNKTVRIMGSFLFLLKMMLYIPIVIYVPALAFSQVTGINLHLITPLVCIVCIFYTTFGGLKAVVWTDTVQTIILFGALICILVIGVLKAGGFDRIWQSSLRGDRIEFFNMNIDPTERHTFWTVFTGNYFLFLASCSVNQAMVQRCLSMPSIRNANITVIILQIGITLIVSISCFTGLIIYTVFENCDPITSKAIGKPDQLLPYFVMKATSEIPGFPGLFISGVFSAALSSMSTGLNSMTGVIFEDLIRPHFREIDEVRSSVIMKVIVVVIGILCVTLVFVVEKLGALIQASNSMSAITAGPLLGIFTLGILFPSANSTGALVGGFVSLVLVAWISIGTQFSLSQGLIRFRPKPVSIDKCPNLDHLIDSLTTNRTDWNRNLFMGAGSGGGGGSDSSLTKPFVLYRISYLYYTLIGAITAIAIGLLVSLMTDGNRNLNKDLFAPFLRKYIRKNSKNNGNSSNSNSSSCGTGNDDRFQLEKK